MTIDFDEIGLHDLVELEADGRHIEVAGWYHVDWIGQAWGERLLEVEILGTHNSPRTLRKADPAAALIRRHIRAVDIPAIVDTLDRAMEQIRTLAEAFGLTETS